MYYSKERIMLNKINQIGEAIYAAVQDIPLWDTWTGHYAAAGVYEDIGVVTQTQPGDHWRCGDGSTRWFRAQVEVPPAWAGRRVILELDFGGEGLVRVNGAIVSGITSFLRENAQQRERVMLSRAAQGAEVYDIEVECGLNYMEFERFRSRGMDSVEYTFRKARLCALDDAVESYYFDAMVAYEALAVLAFPYDRVRQGNVKVTRELAMYMYQNGKDSYLHDKVLAALMASLAAVDVDFSRERLVASIPEAARILQEGLQAIDYTPRGHVCFTGNAHIDTAWHWPVKETVRKVGKTFGNALSLMEQYPQLVFAASQAWQYDALKAHYPELFEKVRQRVAEGRWEVVGNSWVEADTNVPSGEALVRQLLYGREFFMKEFGVCSDVYWMPDVFGYSWALPQIIRRSGMKYFFTAKLNNNDINRFPHTLFWWQGIDGTRIPAYLQRMSYNGEINPFYAAYGYHENDQKSVYGRQLQTYGFGDGGGGPTYRMLEFADRMEAFPGLPNTSLGRTEDFYAGVPEDSLPVWNDEMYYEFHRGTYTSQAHVKRNNRKGELSLRQAEMACSMAGALLNKPYPMEALTEGWKLILLNQFHDIIPGSSIHAVYEDCKEDYARALMLSGDAQDEALAALAGAVHTESDAVVVYNFLSWPRTGMAEVLLPANKVGYTIAGVACAAQTTEQGVVLRFMAEDVPAMGYRAYPLIAGEPAEQAAVSVSETSLENECLSVALDDRGLITSIYDKQAGREVLRPGGLGNLLTIFEDKPERESAWNIDIEYKNKCWQLTDVVSVRVVECSPVRGAVEVVRKFHKSTITQRIILYPGSRRIDFDTHVDWQETEKMLKAAFEVDILSPKATYEIAYGAIERPTHTNTLWDQAKFEVPAHKWADLSEGGYGVALLNDCKYGYDIQDHTMRLTLLRSPVYPDPTADKGEHSFVYSLYPHEGGWREADVVQAGYELNVPLTAVATGAHEGALPPAQSWVMVSGEGVVAEALKRSQDGQGLILRVYESKGIRGTVKVDLCFDARQVHETNLMEAVEAPVALTDRSFAAPIAPFEIKTFLIRTST